MPPHPNLGTLTSSAEPPHLLPHVKHDRGIFRGRGRAPRLEFVIYVLYIALQTPELSTARD
jgi:hypothetical protein